MAWGWRDGATGSKEQRRSKEGSWWRGDRGRTAPAGGRWREGNEPRGMEALEARGQKDGETTADGGKVKARGRARRARREVPRGEDGDGGGGRRRTPGQACP